MSHMTHSMIKTPTWLPHKPQDVEDDRQHDQGANVVTPPTHPPNSAPSPGAEGTWHQRQAPDFWPDQARRSQASERFARSEHLFAAPDRSGQSFSSSQFGSCAECWHHELLLNKDQPIGQWDAGLLAQSSSEDNASSLDFGVEVRD